MITGSSLLTNFMLLPAFLGVEKDPYSTTANFKTDILYGFMPETVVIVTILLLCCFCLINQKYRKPVVIYTSYIGLIISLFFVVFSFSTLSSNPLIFKETYSSDALCIIFRFIILISTIIVLALTNNYMEKTYRFESEFYVLLLTATLGAMLMSGANDLIIAFVGMETLGISSYLLTGYIRTDERNNEAALKYLIIGSAATAILLFGMSYLYGLTGSTAFHEIANKLSPAHMNITLFVLIIMLIAGIGYKMAIAPFHVWAPDVYQGAPTPYTAFLSVASKAAGFVLMIRVLFIIFGDISLWQVIFAILAILSMFLGNLTAIVQKDIKRLLAYSSIAHAGYISIGLIVATNANIENGLSSMLYYLIVYMFMQLGAWCAVILFYNLTGSDKIEDYAGLAYKRPLLAGSFTLCLLSLAGIPITAGFFAKFYIFQAAILGGSQYLWLIIIALINSAISMYYYMYVIKTMLVKEQSECVKSLDNHLTPDSKALSFALGFTVSAVIIMGIFASPLIQLSNYSIQQLKNYKANIINMNIF